MTDDFKHAHITGQEMRDHWGPIVDRIGGEVEASRDPRLKEMEAEIERLREAGTKLAGYAGHDANCEDVTGAYPGSCSCGYTSAWKAWAALGEGDVE